MIRMERLFLLATALLFNVALISSNENHKYCPQKCHCSENNYYTLHCTSLDFIKSATPKELSSITSLNVSQASLTSLNKHLVKKLVNLERLDLSNNKLTVIKHFPQLPKLNHLILRRNNLKTLPHKNFENLEVLDISYNYIQQIPKEVLKWRRLKRIYIEGNKFICNSESLKIRDDLLERHVQLLGNAKCSDSSRNYGKSWKTAIDLDGGWLELGDNKDYIGDEPEGSGEVSNEVNPWSTTHAPDDNKDYGSGEGDFNFDTSEVNEENEVTEHEELLTTEQPHEEHVFENEGSGDEENSEEDIFSTTEVIEPFITTKKTVQVETAPKPTEDLTDTIIVSTQGPDDNNMNEELGNVEAAKANESSLGTNIFLILILVALVALLVYFVKKKKANRERNERQKEDDFGKPPNEVELLPKTSFVNEKQNGNPETTPLMNGNGDVDKDHCEKETTDSLKHSPVELRKNDVANGNSSSPSHSPNQEVLSVRVKTSEIPDSVPKTPILVDRRKTSDGQNVVTPSPNQNV